MKRDKSFMVAISLAAAGLIFNFAETAYFGWNTEAQSAAERLCDGIAAGMMLSGGVMLLGWMIGITISRHIPGVQIIVRKEGDEQDEQSN